MRNVTAIRQNVLGSVFSSLFTSLLISSVGLYIGKFLPPATYLLAMIIEVGMLIGALVLARRYTIGYGFLYTFSFVSGVALYPTILHFAHVLGANLILTISAITAVTFGTIALYVTKTRANFNFLGGFLGMGLIALIILGIVRMFIPFAHELNLAIAGVGVLIFIGYLLFDISRIVNEGIEAEQVPHTVLSLYLDIINLFIYLLQFAAELIGNNRD